MGTDKALVHLDGVPLLVRALGILRDAGLDAAIAGARSDLSGFAPAVNDAGRGPLGGICAALESTPAELAVFLSVDMPLLPSVLVSFLLDHARRTEAPITLASVNGFAQPFPAVVGRAALPGLQAELQAGNDGCFSAFRAVSERARSPLQILPVEDHVQAGQVEHPHCLAPTYWFLNVNTPNDLAGAEPLLPRAPWRNPIL
jgi:molybdopterin-guanine dinucleotide biosynthesis protein A